MPYKTLLEQHGVLTKWWGVATTAELIQMQEQGHANPNFETIRYSIHDFSECENFVCDNCAIEYSAAIDGAASNSNSHIKVAIVADSPEVTNVVQQYLSIGLSPFPLKMFSSLDEARNWVS